jgi:hypothetical protein
MDPDFEEFVTNDPSLFDPVVFPTPEERLEEHKRLLKDDAQYKADRWTTAYDTYMGEISAPAPPTNAPVAKAALNGALVAYFSIPKTPISVATDLIGFVATFPIYTNLLAFPAFVPGAPPVPPTGPILPPLAAPAPAAAVCAAMAAAFHAWTITNTRVPAAGGPPVPFA